MSEGSSIKTGSGGDGVFGGHLEDTEGARARGTWVLRTWSSGSREGLAFAPRYKSPKYQIGVPRTSTRQAKASLEP